MKPRLPREALEKRIADLERRVTAYASSLDRYKILFASFPHGITISDSRGRIIESNTAADQLLGVTREDQKTRNIDGPEWRIIRSDGTPMPPEEWASVIALKEKHPVYNREMGLVKPDGDTTWINVSAAPLPLEDHGVIITYNDITEYKQVKEALRRSEEKFRAITEQMIDFVVLTDENGLITYASPAGRDMFKCAPEAMLGRHFLEYVAEDSHPSALASFKDIQERGKQFQQLVLNLKRPDGSVFVGELTGSRFNETNYGGSLVVIREIAEIRRIQQQLKTTEEKFRNLFNTMSEGVALHELHYDENGRPVDYVIQDVNPAYERIIGLEKHAVLGRTASDIYKSPAAPYLDVYARVAATGQTERFDVWYAPLEKFFRITVVSPAPDQFATVFEDITGRRQAADRLAESEKKFFAAFMANASLMAISTIKEGRFIDVNQRFMDVLGFERLEVIGKTAAEIGLYASIGQRAEAVRRLREDGFVQNYQIDFKTRSGEIRQGLFSADRIRLPNDKDCWLTVLHDITDLKQLENKLRAGTQFMQMLINAIPIPVFYKNVDGVYQGCNRAFEVFIGRPRNEIIGKTAYDISPPDLAETYQAMDEVLLRQPDRPQVYETDVRQKSGALRRIIFHKAVFYNLNDEPEGLVGAILDITDRKQTEEQVQKTLREKELLLSEIHHRVKNNLQIISSLISLQINELSSPETAQHLRETRSRIQAMAFIHEGLYASSSMSDIEMGGHLEKIANAVSNSYAARLPRVCLEVTAERMVLNLTQAVPLGLVANELLTNAYKHAFSGNIREGRIQVIMRETADQRIQLIISDNGAGMPDAFDWERTPSFGLKLTQELVEYQLEGTLELERGQGTTFKVMFARNDTDE